MAEYFKTKVRFLRQMGNGLIKKESETYLVNALSFTESEAKSFEEVGDGKREVTVMSITRTKISEVILYGDTDVFYDVSMQYTLVDEETEKEKKVKVQYLVNASNISEAYDRTEDHLSEMLVPFEITKVALSTVCDVFEYKAKTAETPHAIERREAMEGNVVLDTPNLKITIEDDNGQLGEPWTSSFAIPDSGIENEEGPRWIENSEGKHDEWELVYDGYTAIIERDFNEDGEEGCVLRISKQRELVHLESFTFPEDFFSLANEVRDVQAIALTWINAQAFK